MKKILLTGDSRIKKELYLKEVIEKFEGVKNIFTPENIDKDSFAKAFMIEGMFARDKIVVLKNFNSYKTKEQTETLKLIPDQHDSVQFFIIDIDKSTKEIDKLKFDETLQFNLPKPWEEEQWIKFVEEIAAKKNKKIERDAVNYLLDILGRDDKFLYEEITKLSVYSEGDTIYFDDVNEITTKYTMTEHEELAYNLSTKKFDKAMTILKELLSKPDFEPLYLLSFLFGYFLDLITILIYGEGKKKYTWPEIQKISKDTGVNVHRTRAFLGLSFSNDKYQKINHENFMKVNDVKFIIFMLERMDRKFKIGEDPRILFTNFVKEVTQE